MTLGKKIQELREKPYRTKLRILWTVVVIAAIIIVLLWIITVRSRGLRGNTDGPLKDLGEIYQNLKNIGN